MSGKFIPAIPGGMRGVVFDDVATPSPRTPIRLCVPAIPPVPRDAVHVVAPPRPVRTGWRKRLWLWLRRRPF